MKDADFTSQATRVLLFRLEIDHQDRKTERQLDPGVFVIGGGLQADLVVPALLDAELCEVVLPETAGQSIKVKALVDGMVVNGRELQLGQTFTARTLDIQIDDVRLGLLASGTEEPVAVPVAADSLTAWLEKSKSIMAGAAGGQLLSGALRRDAGDGPPGTSTPATGGPLPRMNSPAGAATFRNDLQGLIQKNPGYALLGMAAVLALLAFMVSGWPSARLKPMNLGGKSTQGSTERETQAGLLQDIRRRLVSADLGSFIKADPAGNTIRLTGSADPAQAVRLDEIVRLVAKPGAPALRNDVVMTSADAATGVEGIVTMPVKGVISSGGQLFNEGQIIPSGWLIEKIDAAQVTMKRDSITHVITMSETPTPPKVAVQNILAPEKATPDARRSPASAPARGLESISTPPREHPVYPAISQTPPSPQARMINK